PSYSGDDAVGGKIARRRQRVGQQTVLDERAFVEQQRDAVAHEQLVLRLELLSLRVQIAGQCALGRFVQRVVVHQLRRMARMAMSSVIGEDAKSRAASISVLHSTSGSTPGSRRRNPAMRSSPNIASPSRASASPSV